MDKAYIFNMFSDAITKPIRGKISEFSSTQASPPIDSLAQIEKLAELNKAGVLTNEEFQNKKAELLKKI